MPGKTSICRELLTKIPNAVLLNGGNLYRAIVYALISSGRDVHELKKYMKNVDIKHFMDLFKIHLKIENKETKVYINGELADEKELQSKESSLAVSLIGGTADNSALFEFSRELIEQLRQQYHVIISGRSLMEIYPNLDYHFFITASLEERVNRKYIQYEGKETKAEIEDNIKKRDSLQEKAGFYKLYPNTIKIDVTDCKSIEESTLKVLQHITYKGNMAMV